MTDVNVEANLLIADGGTSRQLNVTDFGTNPDVELVAKARPRTGEELRFDDVSGGDLYIGAAPDGTSTGSAAWKVVRYYRTATGVITRLRYRTGVAWDSRTAGW